MRNEIYIDCNHRGRDFRVPLISSLHIYHDNLEEFDLPSEIITSFSGDIIELIIQNKLYYN